MGCSGSTQTKQQGQGSPAKDANQPTTSPTQPTTGAQTLESEPAIVPQKQTVEGENDASLPPQTQMDNKHIENHTTEGSPKEPAVEEHDEKKDEEKPTEEDVNQKPEETRRGSREATDTELSCTRTEEPSLSDPVVIETAPPDGPQSDVLQQDAEKPAEEPAEEPAKGE